MGEHLRSGSYLDARAAHTSNMQPARSRAPRHAQTPTRPPIAHTLSRVAGRCFNVVAWTALIAGLATNLVAPVLAERSGHMLITVLSGSMTPTHAVGTTLLVDTSPDPEQAQVGDAVTFMTGRSRTPTTHRIIERFVDDANELWFRTQGDANEDPDPAPVAPVNIVGTVVDDLDHMVSAPVVGELHLGRAMTWTRSFEGRVALFAPAIVQVIFSELAVALAGMWPFRRKRTSAPALETDQETPAPQSP